MLSASSVSDRSSPCASCCCSAQDFVDELWVAVDFVRVNVAVTKVCFFLVRSTSLELSPDSAAAGFLGFGLAAGFLGFGLAAGIFSDSRDGEDGTAIDAVHCSQLCFA